jgi:cobalt-zinc-cadmium efflux system outer membrane protein
MKAAPLGGAIALALLSLLAGSAKALDLETVFREVATTNPTLAARREMVEAAERRAGPAGAWQSPMVELGVVNVPTTGRFDQDMMTMKMVGISQRVPLFGSNRISRNSAQAAAGAEGAGLEMARYQTYAMAWAAYADAYFAERLVRAAVAHQSDADRLVRSAQVRYESGNGRLEDFLRAQSERAQSLSDLIGFQAEARGARARLAAVMGRDPSGFADSLAAPPSAPVPDQPAAWLAAVGDSHPRLRELQAQVDRYHLGARASRRTAWPDLELRGSYGFREPIYGMEQDDLWSATVGFTLPLFARSGELSEGKELEAMARSYEAERRAAALDLQQQVLATHALALADQRTVTLLADTVLATQRRAVEASWGSYSAGASDLWRVLEATHSLYGQDIALIRARQDLARTEARLLAITARGDLIDLTLPESPRNER